MEGERHISPIDKLEYRPLVSVIIPCYNVEGYLQECLASVYAQSYPNIEVICVDNNSDDGTLNKLQELNSEGWNFKILQEMQAGANAARNLGMAHAKGEWLQFMDADDLLLPDKILHQLEALQDDKHTAFVAGGDIYRNLDGSEYEEKLSLDPWFGLLDSSLGVTSSNLFSADLLQAIGGWNRDLASSQEYELMFRCMKQNDAVLICPKAEVIIRDRASGSISKTDVGGKWKRYLDLRLEMIAYLQADSPQWYARNEKRVQQVLFEILRKAYASHPEEVRDMVKRYLPSTFRPLRGIWSGPLMGRIYEWLGFENIERLRSWIRGPSHLAQSN